MTAISSGVSLFNKNTLTKVCTENQCDVALNDMIHILDFACEKILIKMLHGTSHEFRHKYFNTKKSDAR